MSLERFHVIWLMKGGRRGTVIEQAQLLSTSDLMGVLDRPVAARVVRF